MSDNPLIRDTAGTLSVAHALQTGFFRMIKGWMHKIVVYINYTPSPDALTLYSLVPDGISEVMSRAYKLWHNNGHSELNMLVFLLHPPRKLDDGYVMTNTFSRNKFIKWLEKITPGGGLLDYMLPEVTIPVVASSIAYSPV